MTKSAELEKKYNSEHLNNNPSDDSRDKCDNCGSTNSISFWDFDDGSVLCDKCHEKIGNIWQKHIEVGKKQVHHKNQSQTKELKKVSKWVIIIIVIINSLYVITNPESLHDPTFLVYISIGALGAHFCSKYASLMQKNPNVAYILGFLFPLIAGIVYLILYNKFKKGKINC